MADLPKYTQNKMKGNIGEAIVQYLLSTFCLVHKIDGSNDIGNDFICELIKEQAPTNLLFYVQVKFYEGQGEPSIRKETRNYWRSSPIPVYVFWVRRRNPPSEFEDFSSIDLHDLEYKYKRMSPEIHNPKKHPDEPYHEFDSLKFKRHLIIDHERSQFHRGFVEVVKPGDYLKIDEKVASGFQRYQISVEDVAREYRNPVLQNGWAQPYVVAELLLTSDNKKDIMLAGKVLDAAEALLDKSRDRNKTAFKELLSGARRTYERKA